MLARFTKNSPAAAADMLTCIRTDGSSTWHEMPRQGILPHDAFHFVVESTLGWHDAFFGQVAAGRSLTDVMKKLHGGSATWTKNTQALQSESVIECLEAEQWGGPSDPAEFAQRIVRTSRRHGVPPPDITAEEVERIRIALREFGAVWRPLPPGGSVERTF